MNPQSFCTGVSLHHPALIQNTGPLIDMSDIRPGTSKRLRGGFWEQHGVLADTGKRQGWASRALPAAPPSALWQRRGRSRTSPSRRCCCPPQQGAGVQAPSPSTGRA